MKKYMILFDGDKRCDIANMKFVDISLWN